MLKSAVELSVKSAKSEFVVPPTAMVQTMSIPRVRTGVVHESTDDCDGSAPMMYVFGEDASNVPPDANVTAIEYAELPPGATVNTNDVPLDVGDGVLNEAVDVTTKSENSAFVVPSTLIVHAMGAPKCITGVKHATDDDAVGLPTMAYACGEFEMDEPPFVKNTPTE